METLLPSTPQTVLTADGSLTLLDPELLETYHSKSGAKKEAWDLYIRGSGILDRVGSVRVLDIGLGLGYNALSSLEAWAHKDAFMDLHSIELQESLVEELLSGKAPWCVNWEDRWLEWVTGHWSRDTFPGMIRYRKEIKTSSGKKHWTIYVGDAFHVLPIVPGLFDYMWQDPFSPKKNPALWTCPWFNLLHQKLATDGLILTYSVARSVRDELEKAQFIWEKWSHPKPSDPSLWNPGKRHWLKAYKRT